MRSYVLFVCVIEILPVTIFIVLRLEAFVARTCLNQRTIDGNMLADNRSTISMCCNRSRFFVQVVVPTPRRQTQTLPNLQHDRLPGTAVKRRPVTLANRQTYLPDRQMFRTYWIRRFPYA